jgi:serine/threonine-protein kinase
VVDVAQSLAAGRYELGPVIGSGGTGSVREAYDTLLERDVAVKLLRPGADDETVRPRLRAEAQLAGSLVHPGIAQVYDYGEEPGEAPDADPTPYIVMQRVEGVSLWELLRERGTLPATEVMRIVAQAAEALEVAHEAGIVHRDLKPANLLLTPDDGVVIVDFGIARTRGGDPLTRTGAIVGTVDYISPEQAEGRSADARSDLYSLGMVAYECLSGRKPFRKETEVATALAHLREEPPALGSQVPSSVRALVGQMVAKDPADRPRDAAEVARRAAALSVPSPVVLPPPPTPTAERQVLLTPIRSRRPPLPRSAYVAAAALVATLVATALVAARSPAVRVPDLRGTTWSAARADLARRHLVVRRVLVDDPVTHRGVVVHQDVAAGRSVDDGDAVTLAVATGRTDVSRADLLGETWRQAARDLVELGLVPERAAQGRAALVAGGAGGRVVGVHPVGRLRLGATVTLTVATQGSRR